MGGQRQRTEPITIERVERALDKLAEAIILLGDDGVNVLPLYDHLESELETMKAHEVKMDKIRARAARSKQLREREDRSR